MSIDINDICIISYQICYIINRYHSFCYLLAEIEELGDPDQPLKLVRVERRCVEEVIFDHGGGDNDHGDHGDDVGDSVDGCNEYQGDDNNGIDDDCEY